VQLVPIDTAAWKSNLPISFFFNIMRLEALHFIIKNERDQYYKKTKLYWISYNTGWVPSKLLRTTSCSKLWEVKIKILSNKKFFRTPPNIYKNNFYQSSWWQNSLACKNNDLFTLSVTIMLKDCCTAAEQYSQI